jgi:hypothetical protein
MAQARLHSDHKHRSSAFLVPEAVFQGAFDWGI